MQITGISLLLRILKILNWKFQIAWSQPLVTPQHRLNTHLEHLVRSKHHHFMPPSALRQQQHWHIQPERMPKDCSEAETETDSNRLRIWGTTAAVVGEKNLGSAFTARTHAKATKTICVIPWWFLSLWNSLLSSKIPRFFRNFAHLCVQYAVKIVPSCALFGVFGVLGVTGALGVLTPQIPSERKTNRKQFWKQGEKWRK